MVVYLASRRDHALRPAMLRRLAEPHGLHVVDVSEAFEGTDPNRYRIYPTNLHPNAEAHRIFAGVIHRYLAQLPSQSGDRR